VRHQAQASICRLLMAGNRIVDASADALVGHSFTHKISPRNADDVEMLNVACTGCTDRSYHGWNIR